MAIDRTADMDRMPGQALEGKSWPRRGAILGVVWLYDPPLFADPRKARCCQGL
jgi:hypothetical protein